MAGTTLSRIVTGKVMHHRRQPVDNRFVYPVFFVVLNLQELDSASSWLFGINRLRPLSMHYKDYGDGRDPVDWLSELLNRNGIPALDGPIWLQTFPRVFGYVFNPVNFWYCTRRDGAIGAIVAEVNNTFGERHCYVLTPDAAGEFRNVIIDKRFYVSPFFPVKGRYQFTFSNDIRQPRVCVDYYDGGELQLHTAIWGKSRELTKTAVAAALFRQPLVTIGIFTKIHWQALRLWMKRVSPIERQTSSVEEVRR